MINANALTRIKFVPLAYNHASLHMSAILMTLMSLNMWDMLGTRLPQQISCIEYRRCINRTNFLQCIQKVHRPHTISLQASNPVSTHEFLTSSWGAGCCGMWATQETYLLYVNNMTSITQVTITRLPVAQRVFRTHFAKTIRIPRHHRIALRATATQRTTTCFTASFPTICRNI